jgi:predicted enzyme related to lactoylglutathione lyase
VDAGGGWLIFAMPPAELAVHPGDEGRHELYLMCDDIQVTVDDLAAKGVTIGGPIEDQGWGLLTSISLPGGTELGLYQPKHPTAAH